MLRRNTAMLVSMTTTLANILSLISLQAHSSFNVQDTKLLTDFTGEVDIDCVSKLNGL